MYWVDFQLAQRKGLKFYQTRSNALIFYDTLPAYCIWKVVVTKSEEIIYQPPKISYKDNWTYDLDSDVAGKQQREPTNPTKTHNPIIKYGETRMWARVHKGNRETYCVWSRGCHRLNKYGEEDQTRTGRPVLVEEQDIDFRVPGLSHSVVHRIENFNPTCSRITSTTHSAKTRRRWSANWVMWSYSSCGQLYQKYNVLTVFFIGIKELSIALADSSWLTANPGENLTN